MTLLLGILSPSRVPFVAHRAVQDDALHAAHQNWDIEVDEQREGVPRGFQVREGLRDVDLGEAIDSFELHDKDTLAEKVHSTLADLLSLVVDEGRMEIGRAHV